MHSDLVDRINGLAQNARVQHGKEAPAAVLGWMATFRTWCAANGFEYMLWDNNNIRSVLTENSAVFDAEPQYCGKADVARLEILYKYGGIYIDSDMVDLGKDFGPFVGQEKENARGLANSVIGSSRGNLITYTLLKLQPMFFWGCPTAHPFERTGPLMFDHVLYSIFSHITIFPFYVFFPFFWGHTPGQAAHKPMTVAEYNTAYPLSFTVQCGYSTNNLETTLV
ncbi:hypothetical protein SARC_03975 [Sphaeroforma arctica JP610]|uniref:Alpha 1,4-glycosyltransferase domain-containing protein n=1 Tax=Sphaeroforma arctica JP610 TaxID=667725 RepID=A0A0L0G4H8_9EUKA|nr:hypothetical protein SARC_03975 [Sphaeroforma arctica JP610]KNC83799.1 hypothetical protein SARC_03975 [Sphaeroforma arctica JP610]|eukprot:XP_014157701.1 hypothetical protein SARC_03975 [Sphaeroforma arctica JP610]